MTETERVRQVLDVIERERRPDIAYDRAIEKRVPTIPERIRAWWRAL